MMKSAARLGLQISAVVFDAWYFQSLDFLKGIRELGFHWIGRAKEDRIFYVDGMKRSVKELLHMYGKKLKLWRKHPKYRKIRYFTLRAKMPDYGPVTLLLLYDPKSEDDVKWSVLVCSDPKARGQRIVRLYVSYGFTNSGGPLKRYGVLVNKHLVLVTAITNP